MRTVPQEPVARLTAWSVTSTPLGRPLWGGCTASLPAVTAPALVVMGTADPDLPDRPRRRG